jgi:CBS domain-containing protein
MSVKTVGDLMHKGVIACSPETPLIEVVRIINDTSVHAIMVLGPRSQPSDAATQVGITTQVDTTTQVGITAQVGIITHMDIIRCYGKNLNQLAAGEIMTGQVYQIEPDQPAQLAAERMLQKGVEHLLVIERQGDERLPVGVISTTDLIREMRGSRWIWHIG